MGTFRLFTSDLEVKGRLGHAKGVFDLVGEFDIVVMMRVGLAKEAQVDNDALINVGGNLTISKGVAMDLCVPRIRVRYRGCHLWVRIVEGKR